MVTTVNSKVIDILLPNGLWAKTYFDRVLGKQRITKSHQVWMDFNKRCRAGSAAQRHRPTYESCSVSDNFKDYQYFARWYVNQVGYDCDKYHLDKDILTQGNKIYHENLCVLIPAALNSFLTNHRAARGPLPQGVYPNGSMYGAHITRNGRLLYCGSYYTIEEASAAYKTAKEDAAKEWYHKLESGLFKVDERVIDVMKTWEFKESD